MTNTRLSQGKKETELNQLGLAPEDDERLDGKIDEALEKQRSEGGYRSRVKRWMHRILSSLHY